MNVSRDSVPMWFDKKNQITRRPHVTHFICDLVNKDDGETHYEVLTNREQKYLTHQKKHFLECREIVKIRKNIFNINNNQ